MRESVITKGIGFKVHAEVFEIRLAGMEDEVHGTFAEVWFDGERTLIGPVARRNEAYGGRPYRMISFIGDFPLDMVGFLASISKALAARKIPIFVVSSYRTDHLLLMEKDLQRGIEALESLGMVQR